MRPHDLREARLITRYQIVRGAPARALPKGVRQDTRKHTHHVLRPDGAMVDTYLAAPGTRAWQRFARDYRDLLEERFRDDRRSFDALAELARENDVYLGCNCPTHKNPSVRHCHTWLALEFLHRHYPKLDVRMPKDD